jgi:predicted Co/Zn/Cd cation transporter (cation efflux family)
MIGATGRFLFAFFVLSLTMCVTVASLVVALAHTPKDFLLAFGVTFPIAAVVIPLHVLIAFLCSWIMIHTHRRSYYRWLDFALWGGFCGVFVFVTLPIGNDPTWYFGWNTDMSKMKPHDWYEMAALIFSGALGGIAASFVRRDLLE